MKIITKANENLELNSDSIYVKGVDNYNGNNIGNNNVKRLTDFIPKITNVTNLINEALDSDVYDLIQNSSFIEYNNICYPKIAFSDINSYVNIHEYVNVNSGNNADIITALFGHVEYEYSSSTNKYGLFTFSIFVLYSDADGNNRYLSNIEM